MNKHIVHILNTASLNDLHTEFSKLSKKDMRDIFVLACRKEQTEIALLASAFFDIKKTLATVFFDAVTQNRQDTLSFLMDNFRDKNSLLPTLKLTAQYGRTDMFLRMAPLVSPEGVARAYIQATRNRHLDIIESAFSLVSGQETTLFKAFLAACDTGYLKGVQFLLPHVNPAGNDSEALFVAATKGHKDVVSALLPLSNPLARNSVALRDAATYGHKDVVELLLPESDPNAREGQALQQAITFRFLDIFELLYPVTDVNMALRHMERYARLRPDTMKDVLFLRNRIEADTSKKELKDNTQNAYDKKTTPSLTKKM